MLTQAQTDIIAILRSKTYECITAEMPMWRQLKWSQYMVYHARGIDTLNGYERAIAKTMINEGQNHREVYHRVKLAFGWLAECNELHDNLEKEILRMTDAEIANLNLDTAIEYPIWPL